SSDLTQGLLPPIVIDPAALPGSGWYPSFDSAAGGRRVREYIEIAVDGNRAHLAWTHAPTAPSRVYAAYVEFAPWPATAAHEKWRPASAGPYLKHAPVSLMDECYGGRGGGMVVGCARGASDRFHARPFGHRCRLLRGPPRRAQPFRLIGPAGAGQGRPGETAATALRTTSPPPTSDRTWPSLHTPSASTASRLLTLASVCG